MRDKRARAIQKRFNKDKASKAKDEARNKAKAKSKIITSDAVYKLISDICSSEALPLTDELFNELVSSGFPKNRSDFDALNEQGFLFNPVRRSFFKLIEDGVILEVDKDESRILDVNLRKN